MNLANAKHAKAGVEAPAFYPPMTTKESLMSVPNFNAYPSVNEQALEVSNELHDELHLIIDQIRMDISPKVAVLVYVELIHQARRMLRNMQGECHG